ncbi:MAG: gamma-glutamyltransferase [Cyclobacteriaceae bacterium]|nr:gamma-glutamyltransferase [Cyclobacteriaceae bacterium]
MRKLVVFLWAFAISCRPAEPQNECQGVVSTASPGATEAGLSILRSGGNAADAAVAISFVLGVTEPAMSGLGGGCQIILSKTDETPIAINGTTLAPTGTDTTITKGDLTPYTKSSIPSMVKTMAYLHRNHGSGNLTWAELIDPAIEIAHKGFVVGPFLAKVYQEYGHHLIEGGAPLSQWLKNGQDIPVEGDTIKQPTLARTLKIIAEKGPDSFYKGEIAQQISRDMQLNGGWITLEDLKRFPEPRVSPALTTTYFSHTLYTSPPPAGGATMLYALELMEKYHTIAKSDTTNDLVSMVLSLHQAHENRRHDPLPQEDFQKEFNQKIKGLAPANITSQFSFKSNSEDENGETTHYSVVDGSGMSIAVTASINAYFGSRAASEELGFLYNSYMTDFIFEDPTNYYAIKPGQPAYSSMSPTIVRKDEQDVLVLGSPGSKRIISAVAQIVKFWVTVNSDIQEAVAQPRIHALDSSVWVEEWNKTEVDRLLELGFKVKQPQNNLSMGDLNAYFGGVHAIALEYGKWVGTADPRRDGAAGGCQ